MKGRWKRRPSRSEKRRRRERNKENDSKKSYFLMVSSDSTSHNWLTNFVFPQWIFILERFVIEKGEEQKKREERKKLKEMWYERRVYLNKMLFRYTTRLKCYK